jgi:metal-sulfur cluster biosynthetic enzyme
MHVTTDTNVREALRHVVDPEIGVNIVDLGLVYRIDVEGTRVRITMTMTSPACPLAEYLKGLVTSAIRRAVPDVVDVDIDLVSEPRRDPDMMSDEARRQLGEGER